MIDFWCQNYVQFLNQKLILTFLLVKLTKPTSFGAKEAKLWGWLHCSGLKNSQILVAAEQLSAGPFLFGLTDQKWTRPLELLQPLCLF